MRRLLVAASGLVVVVAATATALLLLGDRSTPESEPRLNANGVAASAAVTSRQHLFGDTVSASVEVVVDRERVDPASVSLRTRFDPFEPVAGLRAERRDAGRLGRVRFSVELRCLEVECVSIRAARTFAFPTGVVVADGERVGAFRWPRIEVGSRVAQSVVASGSTAVGNAWRADVADLAAPTYRISPGVARVLLLGLAAVLALAAVAILVLALRRRAPARPRVPALELALRLLEKARRSGEPAEERKALDLLSTELSRAGESTLAHTASELAWARPRPASSATERLSESVDALVRAGRNGRAP